MIDTSPQRDSVLLLTMSRPRYISIEGNIGTGKSTFLRLLTAELENSIIVPEPVDAWTNNVDANGESILDKFYAKKSRWSYAFQMLAFMSRLKDLQNLSYDSTTQYVFGERCLQTDKEVFARQLYADGCISYLEWSLYEDWFSWLNGDKGITSQLKTPDYHIYLRASPEVCASRIIKRDRRAEHNITISYLKHIHNRHDNWLLDSDKGNVLIIDCDKDFESSPEYFKTIMTRIREFLK